jgi:6-phosphogluconolactonase
MNPQVFIAPSSQAWIDRSVDSILQAASGSIQQRGQFSLVLSGGSTPRPVYQALAQPGKAGEIDWYRTHIFWGDERAVPPGHPDSNYRMAKQALLDHVSLPPENIYRIHGEFHHQDSAKDYQGQIKNYFGNQEQRFDLVLLGLGADGHTASLFPESEALEENHLWAAANYAPSQQAWRITLTYPALLNSHQVIFLVKGSGKAEIVKRIIQDPQNSTQFPAAAVAAGHPNLTWVLDQDAASLLEL